jgi:hypothetical protein
MSDDAPSTDFANITRIREAAAMSKDKTDTTCNVKGDGHCSFMAAQENLLLTLKELSRGQKDLTSKLENQGQTLHKIELRLERGDSALANASHLANDVEKLKLWQAAQPKVEPLIKKIEDLESKMSKAEGSALMLKWLIGLAVGGGAAGIISIILFLAKK